MDLELRRRFFAEEIEAVTRLRSPALVEALASVPRERFLRRVRGRSQRRPTWRRMNAALAKAMMTGPQAAQAVTRLRRDPHDVSTSCWLHDAEFCLSS